MSVRFEAVAAKPSLASTLLHVRYPGAPRTLCDERVTETWTTWSVLRFLNGDGRPCGACRDRFETRARNDK